MSFWKQVKNEFRAAILNFLSIFNRKKQKEAVLSQVSPLVVSILQSCAKAVFVPSTEPRQGGWSDLLYVGTLNGTIKVYSSLYVGNNILVAYKGSSTQTDTGYIFAPYITVKDTGVVVSPDSFEPRIGFMTRYGKFAQTSLGLNSKTLELSKAHNYYGVINVSALGTMFGEEVEKETSDLEIGEKALAE